MDDSSAAHGANPSATPEVNGVHALGAVVQRRLVAWNPDGSPVVVTVPMLTKSQIGDMATAAISLLYNDPLGLEPEFHGLTNAEVMMIRVARRAAAGDFSATDMILDRVLGKPKQSSENVNVKVTYEDFLREQAAKEAQDLPRHVVEGEVGRDPAAGFPDLDKELFG